MAMVSNLDSNHIFIPFSVLAAALMCSSLALSCAGVEMIDLPVACSVVSTLSLELSDNCSLDIMIMIVIINMTVFCQKAKVPVANETAKVWCSMHHKIITNTNKWNIKKQILVCIETIYIVRSQVSSIIIMIL